MKRIIDVDEKLVCEGFVRNFTEEERDILIRAIRDSTPYEERSQGDLISREALKKALSEPLYRSTIKDFGEVIEYTHIMNTIDNAPTVEDEILTKSKSDSAVDIDGFGINGY